MITLSSILSQACPSEGGCMLLGKQESKNRYWTFGFNGKTERAHRIVWILTRGPIPPGMVVRHKCDMTRCVNPEHLELGTMADNGFDRDSRGRNNILGENAYTAKLTREKVLDIYSRGQKRGARAKLAAEYGVSVATISRIVTRRAWKHVLLPGWPHTDLSRKCFHQ